LVFFYYWKMNSQRAQKVLDAMQALYRADEKTAPAFEEAGAELPQELHSAAAFT
jgi:hypothetical protein